MSQKIVKITEVVVDFLDWTEMKYNVLEEQQQKVLNSMIGKFYVVDEKLTSQNRDYIFHELENYSMGFPVLSFKYETATYDDLLMLALEYMLD